MRTGRLQLQQYRAAVAGWCLLTLTVAGCGGNRPDVAPVSGVVTVHGKPLANTNVSFQPTAGPGSGADAGFGSFGTTDSTGRFQLKTLDNRSGAVVGRHVVRLASQTDHARDSDKWGAARVSSPLPPRASDGSLTFDVPAGGADQVHFDF